MQIRRAETADEEALASIRRRGHSCAGRASDVDGTGRKMGHASGSRSHGAGDSGT